MRTAITVICLTAALTFGSASAFARLPNDVQEQVQTTSSPPVIHELHTVVRERDAGRTLAFVLSGAALLIAGAGAAYTTVTVRRRPIAG